MLALYIFTESILQKIESLSSPAAAIWLSAFGTIFLGFAAIFQERIKKYWRGNPELEVIISQAPPDCHFIEIRDLMRGYTFPSYYFRLRIYNHGKYRAETVQVFAEKLERKIDNSGSWVEVREFIPMNLLWSHLRKTYMEYIPPEMYRHCDLGHIIKPDCRREDLMEEFPNITIKSQNTIFSLDLEVKPNNFGHLVKPGEYRLNLIVVAANSKPIRRTVFFSHKDWHDQQRTMLQTGVSMHVE